MDCVELKAIDKSAESIHMNVVKFLDSVSEEYIDFPKEKVKEKLARESIEQFQNACADASSAIEKWTNTKEAKLAQNEIERIEKDNEADITLYEKTLEKFYERKEQYEKCSPLTRSLLSPRARSADKLWEDEPIATYPEMNCIMLSLILFGLLLTGWLLVHFGISVDERMEGRYTLHVAKSGWGDGCSSLFGWCNFTDYIPNPVSVDQLYKTEL